MKSRFVVSRSTRWAGYRGARHFLQPQVPEWDENAENQHVEQVLFDVALADIPQEFEFCNVVTDKGHLGAMFGEEGIEIAEFQEPVQLAVGDVVDIDITVIGRVTFSAEPQP